jgi:hypothetical protein
MIFAQNLKDFELEDKMHIDRYHLVKRGQRYGICWMSSGTQLRMIRDLTSGGQDINFIGRATELLFGTDGELRQAARKAKGDQNFNNDFRSFCERVLNYLEYEA